MTESVKEVTKKYSRRLNEMLGWNWHVNSCSEETELKMEYTVVRFNVVFEWFQPRTKETVRSVMVKTYSEMIDDMTSKSWWVDSCSESFNQNGRRVELKIVLHKYHH